MLNQIKEKIPFVMAPIDKTVIDDKIVWTVILTDPVWWFENIDSIYKWINDNGINVVLRGMVLLFDSNEQRLEWVLRWTREP